MSETLHFLVPVRHRKGPNPNPKSNITLTLTRADLCDGAPPIFLLKAATPPVFNAKFWSNLGSSHCHSADDGTPKRDDSRLNSNPAYNEVTPRRAGLVLRWVTVRGYTVLVSNQATRLTQPGHPPAGRRNEYWRWLRPPLGKKRRVLCSSRPCYQDCWHNNPVG